MMKTQEFSNVWDAIEDTPQQAASQRVKADLMMEIERIIQQRGMTQAEAAIMLGVTQPRVSDLMRGKINLFSLDKLLDSGFIQLSEFDFAHKFTLSSLVSAGIINAATRDALRAAVFDVGADPLSQLTFSSAIPANGVLAADLTVNLSVDDGDGRSEK